VGAHGRGCTWAVFWCLAGVICACEVSPWARLLPDVPAEEFCAVLLRIPAKKAAVGFFWSSVGGFAGAFVAGPEEPITRGTRIIKEGTRIGPEDGCLGSGAPFFFLPIETTLLLILPVGTRFDGSTLISAPPSSSRTRHLVNSKLSSLQSFPLYCFADTRPMISQHTPTAREEAITSTTAGPARLCAHRVRSSETRRCP